MNRSLNSSWWLAGRFSNSWRPAALGMVLLLGLPSVLTAQNSVSWKTNYYNVGGATFQAIRQSLNYMHPWKGQSSMDGLTDWRIEWHYTVQAASDGCRCASFTTRTTITITLPRWIAPAEATPEVRTAWTNYITALGKHELGHAQLALAAAAEQQRQVGALGAQPNCPAMNNKINETARKVLEEFRAKDRDYDRTTEHGAKQGAVLPGRGPRRRGPR